MTEKQKRFCIEYAKSGNATEAAKKAGYSKRTAYSQGQRMLKNVEIKKFLQEVSVQSNRHEIAAAQEVLLFLSDVMRNSDVPWKDRLRAAEALAKRQGVDKPAGADEEQEKKLDALIAALSRKTPQDGE